MSSPSPILNQVLERITPALDELIPSGRVLAAVSGGADSLALLQVLRCSGRQVLVGHVNHQMRDAESDADEEFVRALCDELKIPFEARCVQVLGDSNIEAQARALRYAALHEIAARHGCRFVATGHTAGDVLETVLLHWLRGATVTGMRGIEPSRGAQVLAGSPQVLVRPLLDVSRRECEAICREAGWAWREDGSNASSQYLRNRVRHELVPLLAELVSPNGDAVAARERLARQTGRAARLHSDDLALLDLLARDALEKIVVRRQNGLLVLDGDAFGALDVALQRRVLRLGAREVAGEGEVSSLKIEEARAWIVANRRRRVWQWSGALRVEWCGAGSGNRVRFCGVEAADNT
jgi:tRNA(Ile)-lysidine synthase